MHPPWITRSFLSRIKHRNSLFKRAKLTNSPLLWSAYRSYRNKSLSYCRSLKAKFFRRLASSPNSRHFWSSVKKLRKKKSSIPPLISRSGGLLLSDCSKANLLNEFFSSCFNTSSPPLSFSSIPATSPCPPDLLCSVDNILHLLLHLPSDTATGPDGISSRMLKSTAYSIAPVLTSIFNLSLQSRTFPSDWKCSHIVPIPKTNSPSSPSDFRPISLLSIVSKVFERHIHNYLSDFCTHHHIISNCQFGFRPGFSSESALLSVTNSWFSFLDSYKSVCAVFFDLRKAFDSVPHRLLLDTLSSLHIPPVLLHWLHDYLCDRSQLVVINGSCSLKSPVLSGVPQGSILGPLLFILYINGLSNIPLLSSAKLTMYADDILLSHPINSSADLPSLQSNINSISSWFSSNLLTVNSSKTKYMFIALKNPPFLSSLPPLYLDDSPLELVSCYKYLGVFLSSNLSWSSHIQHICSKSRKLIGFLFRYFYRFSPPSVLFKLYLALIRPHLEYCSSVWDPSSSSLISSLEKVQYFALKLCSKQWSSSYSSLLLLFNCPTLSLRRKFSKLTFLFKVLHGLTYFPSGSFAFQHPPRMSFRSYHPLNLHIPFTRSSAYLNSFTPNVCRLWNRLPADLKDCPSLPSFKFHLCKLNSI